MDDFPPITEQVESGSFVVSGRKDLTLEALLGTCVGIAIVDRNALVGGLYHILLPEPTGEGYPWGLETYATTGLPLFLDALHEAGAQDGRMEAIIAGGAFVGPVSMEDLQMDIGGRITEIVREFVDKHNIPVFRSETGGYFNCRLRLNLRNFESDIKAIGFRPEPPEQVIRKIPKDKIDDMIVRVRPIPQIALKIIRMIHSGDYDMPEVAKEVKQDQVISAKVIQTSNSSYFSPKHKIDSIDKALVMLGERMILQLVVSASLKFFFDDSDQGYSLCRGGLFHHSLSSGIVAEKISQFTGKSTADVAYTAGLLHDIGKVVLDQHVAAAYPLFYRRVLKDEMSLVEVENDVLGYNHAEIGKRLAELWSLPEALADVIEYHHEPEKSTVNPELTHITYFADLLVSRFQVGKELDRIDTDSFIARLEKIGLEPAQFTEVIDAIPWKSLAELVQI